MQWPANGAFNLSTERKTMKHHKYHQHYQVRAAKLHARAEAAYDLITALVIGIGLAACLFYGWSA
jgi:hypothetical protein